MTDLNEYREYPELKLIKDSIPFIVYVLECEPGNYFYVGYTSDADTRLFNHFIGKGAEFTKKYKPIKIVEIRPCNNIEQAKRLEQNLTDSYIDSFGIENVCGGQYNQASNRKRLTEIRFINGKEMIQVLIEAYYKNVLVFKTRKFVSLINQKINSEEIKSKLIEENQPFEIKSGLVIRLNDCDIKIMRI